MIEVKTKIDEAKNVLAVWIAAGNFDFPGMPEITDTDVRGGFEAYTTTSSDIVQICRRECFCIMSHSKPHHLAEMSEQKSKELITAAYQRYGRARQLLLMCCLSGLHLARQLASSLGTDVIAPTGGGAIDSTGFIFCEPIWGNDPRGPNLEGSLNWVRITRGNDIIMAGTEILEPSFVRPIPNPTPGPRVPG